MEFFAFNSDPNTPFETVPRKLPDPRVDKLICNMKIEVILSIFQVLFRTLSDMGTRLILRPTQRDVTPIPEKFQLNVSTTYEDVCFPFCLYMT